MVNLGKFVFSFLISLTISFAANAFDDFDIPRPGGVNQLRTVVDEAIVEHKQMAADQKKMAEEVEYERSQWFNNAALDGHKIEVIPKGYDLLRKRLETIVSAKRSIFLSTFIYGYKEDDWSARKVAGALCMMAQKGVEVRLLLDGFGGKKFYHNYKNMLREECNVKVLLFNPNQWGLHKAHYVIHEKFLIVDGEVVMMGGNGIADPYHEIEGAEKHYHDLDIRIWGPAACHYHKIFQETWRKSYKKAKSTNAIGADSYYTEKWLSGESDQVGCQPVTFGSSKVLPLYANPFFQKKRPLYEHYVKATMASKKEILIYAPYFVPHNKMIKNLSNAIKRGVKIKVLTNSIESNDEGFLTLVGMGHKVKKLWQDGLEIHLYKGPKTLHRKGGLFDGKWVYFGSDNQDARGHFYQSESVAFTDDQKTIQEFRDLFEKDLKNSTPLTKAYYKRIMKGAGKLKKWIIKRNPVLKQL